MTSSKNRKLSTSSAEKSRISDPIVPIIFCDTEFFSSASAGLQLGTSLLEQRVPLRVQERRGREGLQLASQVLGLQHLQVPMQTGQSKATWPSVRALRQNMDENKLEQSCLGR